MHIRELELSGALLFGATIHRDERGHFYQAFVQRDFDAALHAAGQSPVQFVQDNVSLSQLGVIRGLHWQAEPFAQGKLVQVLAGSIVDVLLDIRPHSPTFGQHQLLPLSAGQMVWLPAGFAHGFMCTSAQASVNYKTTAYYAPQAERAVRWDDAQLAIDWPLQIVSTPIVSPKDANAPLWQAVIAELHGHHSG